MLRVLAVAAALLSVLLLAYGRISAPEDVRTDMPELFGEWVAGEGLHEGSRMRITAERVELTSDQQVVDSGPLTGIFAVETSEGYDQYRIEYGVPGEPGAITVMLDDQGRLRLANRPATAWLRADASAP